MEKSNGVKKLFLLSAAVFLLAAGCNQAQPQGVYEPLPEQQAVKPAASTTQAVSAQNKGSTNAQKSEGQVSEVVYGSDLAEQPQDLVNGQTGLDLLKTKHKVETKDYGSMGQFVLSIDGMKPSSKQFWEFFVNGKSSNVGASAYVLKAGDKVEWKLSTINSFGK